MNIYHAAQNLFKSTLHQNSRLYFCMIIMFYLSHCCWSVNFTGSDQEFLLQGDFNLTELKELHINDDTFCQPVIQDCRTSGEWAEASIPVYTRLIPLPDQGELRIEDFSWDFEEIQLSHPIFPLGGEDDLTILQNFPQTDSWLPANVLKISDPVIMRDFRFSQLSLFPLQYNSARNRIRILKNIELKIHCDLSGSRNLKKKDFTSASRSFEKIFFSNTDEQWDSNSGISGAYLIIAPDNCQELLKPLLHWKQKLGYPTVLATLSETGTENSDIKDYLQDAYDNWAVPPEYVILVGDINGNIALPSFYVPGTLTAYDVTDHSYTLLEGDDYFPDILLGRLSVRDLLQLSTIVQKIISYEQTPYLNETSWFNRGIVVTYVQSSYYSSFFSARETKMAIRSKLLDFTYTVVDTCISPYQIGQYQLEAMINSGCGLINYRGAGSPLYWAGVSSNMFSIDNILNLNNGYMLPLVTSITCGGGDFAAPQAPSCFGETWLNAGSPLNPKGAIGFIGPSEHDTKTPFNNALDMGIYQGLTREGLFRCGEMLLRGKMELYLNYPNNHAWGNSYNSDQFYFYVYNLLGDPGLAIWTDVPDTLNVFLTHDYLVGSSLLQVQVDCDNLDKSGFRLALTNTDSLLAVALTDACGIGIFPVELPLGEYEVTASGYGYIPASAAFQVSQATPFRLDNYGFDPDPAPATPVILNIIVSNTSEQNLTDINAFLSSPQDFIIPVIDSINIPLLTPGSSMNLDFSMLTSPEWKGPMDTYLSLLLSESGQESYFFLPLVYISPFLSVAEIHCNGDQEYLVPDSENDIEISLLNTGTQETGIFHLMLSSVTPLVEVTDTLSFYSSIPPGETANSADTFLLNLGTLYPGESVSLYMRVISNEAEMQILNYQIVAGVSDINSPTFSSYGYCAIESRDDIECNPPIYEWIELDPVLGGNGILLEPEYATSDGFLTSLILPFNFRFFGRFYDNMTICSNGWLGFGENGQIFHRNRCIPSGSGPDAMIAPFWDALEGGSIFAAYDNENNYLILEWSGFSNVYDPEVSEIFEVILYDPRFYPTPTGDGNMLFQYREIINIDQEDNYATVGIENEMQTDGLLLSFADIYPETMHPLASETAILITARGNPVLPYLTVNPAEIYITLLEDESEEIPILLTNQGGIDSYISYEIHINHFPRNISGIPGPRDANRDLSNDFIFNSSTPFIPHIPFELLFYLVHLSVDNEAVYGVNIQFPSGFFLTGATDINNLIYNGETGDGANISWGYGNGFLLTGQGVHPFMVDVVIDEAQTEPVEVGWTITGDGSGTGQHEVSGNMVLEPTLNDYLWITYPNGFESLLYGLPDTLRWTSYGDINSINIDFSSDSGNNWLDIAFGVENNGRYPFLVPLVISNQCLFRISSPDGNIQDTSDHAFTITGLRITYPDESTVMQYNEADSITWSDLGGAETVKIELSTNLGFTWNLLGENIDNTGYFGFTVPGPISDKCLLRISSMDGLVSNTSPFPFTIIDTPVNWIACNHNNGSLAGGESVSLLLGFDCTGLNPGLYEAFLNIETDIGQKINLPVTLEVIPQIPENRIHILYQNNPNPFNPETTINFELLRDAAVKLDIYNLRGQHVFRLGDENLPRGHHHYIWNGNDKSGNNVSSGIYLYRLKTGRQESIRKMLYIK
ncbi:MAG: T9SS type A sorting domain-containing protein [Candidatus Cloacimonetes bacterium]|nr:T9SS type A sorting domain-containing protein [Candidatus Cloacimonadota bacterium]